VVEPGRLKVLVQFANAFMCEEKGKPISYIHLSVY
jgi:hypothetical protein